MNQIISSKRVRFVARVVRRVIAIRLRIAKFQHDVILYVTVGAVRVAVLYGRIPAAGAPAT